MAKLNDDSRYLFCGFYFATNMSQNIFFRIYSILVRNGSSYKELYELYVSYKRLCFWL